MTEIVPSLAPQCAKISQMLSRIGDKWSVLVIMHLRRRSRRFSELKREVGDISQRMLTLTLRNLERDGLVRRTVTPSTPPRVDYELTTLGHSLAGPVNELGTWVVEHSSDLADAQARFDAKGSTV